MNTYGYDTSMLVDYFSEDGLTKKTGVYPWRWDFVIFKELMDNALDAIEALSEKMVTVNINSSTRNLQIFDNGFGLIADIIRKSIYNFGYYYSSKRQYITPSRGKQGNGLKTIISICFLNNYELLWHTAEGLLEFEINAKNAQFGEIEVKMYNHGETPYRGIEVRCFRYLEYNKYIGYLKRYSMCNGDVTFCLTIDGLTTTYPAIQKPVNKSNNTQISFYDLESYIQLVKRQDGAITYKQFLENTFGKVVRNASRIKGKICNIDFEGDEFKNDFQNLKKSQKKKMFTALKYHLIGLPNIFQEIDYKLDVPCLVEFDVKPLPTKKKQLQCHCYVNNTITYDDSRSICFEYGIYDVGIRKSSIAGSLKDLLDNYSDYEFSFHFIAPQFNFGDTGKTEFDISGIITPLVAELKKAIGKAHRRHLAAMEKTPSSRSLMRDNIDEAYDLASSHGKYAITARQIFYKLRELSGIKETSSTYSDFTQNILTDWLSDHPNAEGKVYFSDRGNFYVGSIQHGLGTGTVRNLISTDGTSANRFVCLGGLDEKIYLKDDFDLRYKYDKVLYIEKTGFDQIFLAEHVGEKYHMIVVSGQGFGTRAAKTLLYDLQQKGLQIYCMHDLDYSGVNILNSLRTPNEKFPYSIEAIDLGISKEDIEKYKIEPEQVPIDENSRTIDWSRYTPVQRSFFCHNGYLQRVELNAFTTEQILEILDTKLSGINNLPTVDVSKVVSFDEKALKEAALIRLLRTDYETLLESISIDFDFSTYAGQMTVYDVKDNAEIIKENMIDQYQKVLKEKVHKIA